MSETLVNKPEENVEKQIKEGPSKVEPEETEMQFIPIDDEKDEKDEKEKDEIQDVINLDSGDDLEEPISLEEGKLEKGGSKMVKIDKAIHIVEKDEYNTDAWRVIMNEVKNMPIDDARPYYEKFLTKFPTASRYWKLYAEHEIKFNNPKKAEDIFSRCLLNNLHVELWQTYLNYVKETKDPIQNRDEIESAYEFALTYIGIDVNSTPIWNDYIIYLRSFKATNQYDQGQNMTKIRKLYQRAIGNSMNGMDQIWKDYELFENEVSPTLAKALLTEQSQRYKIGVGKLKEKKVLREGLLINMLATPYKGTPKEDQQLKIWKSLIDNEVKNVQTKQNLAEVKRNVIFTFNQAILCLYHYPEIWHQYATFFSDQNLYEEAFDIYERSIKALPGNITLYFLYAYFEESKKNYEKAKNIYEKLIEIKQDPLIYIQYMKFAARTKGQVIDVRKIFIIAFKNPKVSYHVYIAAALIEWEDNNDANFATKIFDRGLKTFLTEPVYVNEYLRFLEHQKDKNNTRVLFEKVVTAMPKGKSLEFWNKYIDFEYKYGDKETIQKVLKRRSEIYPEYETSEFQNILNQFSFLDLNVSIPNYSSKKLTDLISSSVHFVKPDLTQMMKIDPRQLIPQNKKEDYVPDPVQKLMNLLPQYDGIVPDIDVVFESLLKNELIPLDDDAKERESDDEDSMNKQTDDQGDIWLRQQKKKKRKFGSK